MDADKLLKQLTMLDFMAVDLALYLNTHPDDREIIEKYNQAVEEGDRLRCLYEDKIGPIYSYRSVSDKNRFTWINCPWPPSYCFNPALTQKDCQ
ncbi:MAG: spore coat protein CotJB [Clostridiales bacterium]|nr:spore coat protein CotJB [Clostridiales bacterium]